MIALGRRLDPSFRPSCPFLRCYAGGGVAGNGCCFLGGDPRDPKCPKFQCEAARIAIFEAVAERDWIAGRISGREFIFGTHR